jgi:hypothetical protein
VVAVTIPAGWTQTATLKVEVRDVLTPEPGGFTGTLEQPQIDACNTIALRPLDGAGTPVAKDTSSFEGDMVAADLQVTGNVTPRPADRKRAVASRWPGRSWRAVPGFRDRQTGYSAWLTGLADWLGRSSRAAETGRIHGPKPAKTRQKCGSAL